jgi:hypothetical protein
MKIKMKLSYKDLLLLVGILVAVIIALTTLVFTEKLPEATQVSPVPKKSSLNASPSVVIKKIIEKADLNSLVRR